MITTFQDKLKPGETSPTAGKWAFQLTANGHIYFTSRIEHDSRELAHEAALESVTFKARGN